MTKYSRFAVALLIQLIFSILITHITSQSLRGRKYPLSIEDLATHLVDSTASHSRLNEINSIAGDSGDAGNSYDSESGNDDG
jgi:hypothetical protein